MVPNISPLLNNEVTIGEIPLNASEGTNITPTPHNKETPITLLTLAESASLSKSEKAIPIILAKTTKVTEYPTGTGKDENIFIMLGNKLKPIIKTAPKINGSLEVIRVVAINPAAPEIGTGPMALNTPPIS